MWTVLRVLESVNSSENASGSYLLKVSLFKIRFRKESERLFKKKERFYIAVHWNRKMNYSCRVILALLSYFRGKALRLSFQYKMDFGSNTPFLIPVRIVTTAPLTIFHDCH